MNKPSTVNPNEAATTLLKNTHLNVSVSGWSTVACVAIICVTGLGIYALRIKYR